MSGSVNHISRCKRIKAPHAECGSFHSPCDCSVEHLWPESIIIIYENSQVAVKWQSNHISRNQISRATSAAPFPFSRAAPPIKVDLAPPPPLRASIFSSRSNIPAARTHNKMQRRENILRAEKSLWLPASLLCDPITHLQALRVTRFCNLSRLVSHARIGSFIYLLDERLSVDPTLK